MPYRLAGRAGDQIDAILLKSARRWGIEAAGRYNQLIIAALAAVSGCPDLQGSREIPKLAGIRVFHLRSARRFVDREHRVAAPRHVLVYRVASDGTVEVLGILHDRMLIARAARRARSEADK